MSSVADEAFLCVKVRVMIVDKAILAALVATVVAPCVGAGLFFLLAGL